MLDQMTQHKKRLSWNSALLGVYFTLPMLTKLFSYFVSVDNNFIFIAAIILGISVLANGGLRMSGLFFSIASVLTVIVLLFSVRMLQYDFSYTQYYLFAFAVYGLASMYLCSKPIDTNGVLRAILAVYALFTVLMLVYYIPEAQSATYYEGSMDISYTSLIGFSALLLYFPHSKRKLTRLALAVMFLINGYYVFFLSDSRGAVLSLLIMLGLVLLQRVQKRKYFAVYVCLLLVALLLVAFSFSMMIEWLTKVAPDVHWVRRFIYADDISTGRNQIYERAMAAIKESPLLGHGIGFFEYHNNGSYTHNVFLQLFVEFGVVIGGAAAAVLTVISLKTLFAKKSDILMIYLFSQFVPRLLVSSVYWENLFIWSFLYLGLRMLSKGQGGGAARAH